MYTCTQYTTIRTWGNSRDKERIIIFQIAFHMMSSSRDRKLQQNQKEQWP